MAQLDFSLQRPHTQIDLATPLNMYLGMKQEKRAQRQDQYLQRQQQKAEQQQMQLQDLATMTIDPETGRQDRDAFFKGAMEINPKIAYDAQKRWQSNDRAQRDVQTFERTERDALIKRQGTLASAALETFPDNPVMGATKMLEQLAQDGVEGALEALEAVDTLTPEQAKKGLQFMASQAESSDAADYSLNIEYGRDKDGKIIPLQSSRKGGLVRAKMPEEVVEFDPGLKYVKQGGKILGKDKFGKVVDSIDVTTTPKEKADIALGWTKTGIQKKKLDMLRNKWDFTKKKAAEKKLTGREAKRLAAQTVVEDMGRGIEVLESNMKNMPITTAAGIISIVAKHIPGSDADILDKYAESVKSNISIDRLQAMREGSPTGGALGQVPVQQQVFLMQLLGSLAVEQKPKILLDNMKRISNIYLDAVHGEGRGGMRYRVSYDKFGKKIKGGRTWTLEEYPEEVQEAIKESNQPVGNPKTDEADFMEELDSELNEEW